MISNDAILEIDWPTLKFDIPIPSTSFNIFLPKEPYTRDNIPIIIWVICSISTYWYHEHTEKVVHATSLVHYLLKIMTKLSKIHRQSIVKYAIEALRMFGDYRTIAENMSYFIQNIEIHNKYKIDWKCLNKLTIAYKYLDIGVTYDFDPGETLRHKKRIGSMVGEEHDTKLNSMNMRMLGSQSNNFTMIEKIKVMHDNPMYEDTVNVKLNKHKSDSKMNDSQSSPINVFEERKKAKTILHNSDTTPCSPYVDGCDLEFFDEEDVIEVKKRTFNLEYSEDEYRYFIIPISK